jgi:quercetin dioxygenase-like cupin family protein
VEVSAERAPALWFLDNLARIHVTAADSGARAGVVELTARSGDMPPLHLHRYEDEIFHVLEGEFSLFVADRHHRLAAGQTRFAPQDVPHTYRVEADRTRWLAITNGSRFASFVGAVARPAPSDELPRTEPPTAEEAADLARIAGEHGIEILGAPGMLPSEL